MTGSSDDAVPFCVDYKTLEEISHSLNTGLANLAIIGAGKSFYPPKSGQWYRLGYLQSAAYFYGEFCIYHGWNNNPTEFSKFIVGCANTGINDENIKEIFHCFGNTKRIKKAVV